MASLARCVIFWPRRGSSARQLRGGRLASLSHGGEPDLLELREQGGRVRSDPRLREHRDGPLALGLRDGPRGGGVDHRARRRPAPGTAFGASRARAGRSAPRTARVRSAAGDDVDIRARACRNTLGESDAWITTTAAAASATVATCVPAASRCRRPTRARRSSTVRCGVAQLTGSRYRGHPATGDAVGTAAFRFDAGGPFR